MTAVGDPGDGAVPTATPHPVRRTAHRERRRRARRTVWAIAGASALLAATAGAAPTGTGAVDLVLLAGAGGSVTLAGSRAARWSWFVGAGVVAATAGADAPVALSSAAGALGTAWWSLHYGRHQRELGALAATGVVQGALRLPPVLGFGVPTIVAAMAIAPVVVSGLRNTRRPVRAVQVAIAALALGAIYSVAAAVVVDGARGDVRDGIAAVRDAIAAAEQGDDAESTARFADATAALDRAHARVDAPWLAPARAVPVLAQNHRAAADVTAAARDLAGVSGEQIAVLDLEALVDATGFRLGHLADLARTARTVEDTLRAADRTIDRVDVGWLVAPLAERVDAFADEIDGVLPAVANTTAALEAAPHLLGVDGPRRYLVLVGNPAEGRELGGFTASVGVLHAEAGRLSFRPGGSIASANEMLRAVGNEAPPGLPAPLRGSEPESYVQNWTNSADFDAVVAVVTTLGPAVAGGPVAGVLYLDPAAVAALLELTGPVDVGDALGPLDAGRAFEHLVRGQYLDESFADDATRKELLAEAATAIFERLTAEVPDPRVLARVLAPAVAERRFLFGSQDPAIRSLLRAVGLQPTLATGAPDQLLVTSQNLRANKLDGYLDRIVDYEVTLVDGTVDATATITLVNRAPDGLPEIVVGDADLQRGDALDPTTHRLSLDVYSRFAPEAVEVDGTPAPSATTEVGGLHRTAVTVEVARGESVVVTLVLRGSIGEEPYAVDLVPTGTAGGSDISAHIVTNGTERARIEARSWDRTLRMAPS